MELIGREREIATFKHCLEHSESKLIAVYGRRRVGKTFLIRKTLQKSIVFEVTGLHNGTQSKQIKHFATTIAKHGYAPAMIANPEDWIEAFILLEQYIDSIKGKNKKVIFIDELPWFDTPRSKFLTYFASFWNQYCTKRNDIIVVICGSAASWMIKNVLKNKGGLHNRVYEKIKLNPFSIYETEKFLRQKGIVWDRYDITQLYMCVGGVPFYLDGIRKGESFSQFIDRAFFIEDGFLKTEFDELFSSLFDNSPNHIKVIQYLSQQYSPKTREDIRINTKLQTGGTMTKALDELEKSGFISLVHVESTDKSKEWYQLNDFYCIFYLKYLGTSKKTSDSWAKVLASPTWNAWAGLAFERICFYHLDQIKGALQIRGIDTNAFGWRAKNQERGAQIDMVINRADRIVNLVEMKFCKEKFTITKEYAAQLRNKIIRFAEWAPKKSLFLTMITPYGVTNNPYTQELVQNSIILDDLFVP